MSNNRIEATSCLGVLMAAFLFFAGCAFPPLPDRFTYVVGYEVTAECSDPLNPPTAVSVEYREDPDPLVPLTAATNLDPPWSVELPIDYDYDNLFTPELRFTSATFAHVGDKLVLKISWKDYQVDFEEETLEEHEVVYTGATPAEITLVATLLPK